MPCSHSHLAKGYCTGHYQQVKKGQPFRPIREMRPKGFSTARNADGNKQCATCLQWSPPEGFWKNSNTPDGLQHQCRPCALARKAERIEADPLKGRRRHIFARFGITLREWEEILDAQGRRCAICGTDDPGARDWNLDHDHKCHPRNKGCRECVRGLLCWACNTGLGSFKDDPERMSAAIAYLERPTSAYLGLGSRTNAA